MRKLNLAKIMFFCFFSGSVYAQDSALSAFNQIFASKKILHAYKDKGTYSYICSEFADQGANRPANFYYDANKKTISFIYMERNEYPLHSITKSKNDFIVSLRDGDLKYRVHQVNQDIYAWDMISKEKEETMYTLFYNKDWHELDKYHTKNECKEHP